jgi:hypothetical protein
MIECGAAPPRTSGGPTLEGRFPARIEAGEAVVSGTVEMVGVLHGVIAPEANVFLVRAGRVVTLPMAQDLLGMRVDLGPGERAELIGHAALVSCGAPEGKLRPAGDYEIHARVVVNHDDGSSTECFGGPWPLAITPR